MSVDGDVGIAVEALLVHVVHAQRNDRRARARIESSAGPSGVLTRRAVSRTAGRVNLRTYWPK
ncbi:hypothetical protein PT2222_10266 [Paraburkholderia tropica]